MFQAKMNKVTLAQSYGRLIAGLKLHLSSTPIVLDGTSYTSQSLIDLFQSVVDALSKADAAKAQWSSTLQQLAELKAEVAPVAGAFRSHVLTINGSSPSALGDYGLSPRKTKTPLSGAQQAAATAKAKATRAARHTMGSKQKQGVTGNVTGVVVTPITEGPVAPATPVTPKPAT